jgi:hypothetical protein
MRDERFMKIAILGGTGHIGKGFALRWGSLHDIIIGSRNAERASSAAKEYRCMLEDLGKKGSFEGVDNKTATQMADVVLLAIKYRHVSSVVESITPVLKDQIVVSVVVPMEKDSCYIIPDAKHMEVDVRDSAYNAEYFCYTQPAGGSAAEEIAQLLPQHIQLVSGFHNVPAKHLEDLSLALDYDIAVCGNDMASKEVICKLTDDIPNLRPLDAGPLKASSMIESLTPLLINIAARNKMDDVGVKFI